MSDLERGLIHCRVLPTLVGQSWAALSTLAGVGGCSTALTPAKHAFSPSLSLFMKPAVYFDYAICKDDVIIFSSVRVS